MANTRTYRTNLRCAACVAKIKPHLDSLNGVDHWQVDLASPDKTLHVRGDAPTNDVGAALAAAGYQLLGERSASPPPSPPTPAADADHTNHANPRIDDGAPKTTYFPLVLLAGFLVGVVALTEVRAGQFDWSRSMGTFMGVFFLSFSFFKLLDLRGFADTYQGYDIIARRVRAYALAYPFIELALGAAYLTNVDPFATNLATLVIMTVSSIGVLQSVLNKRAIRCACLGTVFNLPMSTVTLVEDGLMVAMAATALFLGGH